MSSLLGMFKQIGSDEAKNGEAVPLQDRNSSTDKGTTYKAVDILEGRNPDEGRNPIHDFSSDANLTVGRARRSTITYRRKSCTLQNDPDVPYYVSLAANIFGLEASGDADSNTMNLPFDWQHNDRISADQFNATNNRCLWTRLPHSVVSLNLSLCLCKQLNDKPTDFICAWALLGFLPLFGALFVELSTVNALRSYEDFGEVVTENFCSNDWELQVCPTHRTLCKYSR